MIYSGGGEKGGGEIPCFLRGGKPYFRRISMEGNTILMLFFFTYLWYNYTL